LHCSHFNLIWTHLGEMREDEGLNLERSSFKFEYLPPRFPSTSQPLARAETVETPGLEWPRNHLCCLVADVCLKSCRMMLPGTVVVHLINILVKTNSADARS